jgi:hypothetical protein
MFRMKGNILSRNWKRRKIVDPTGTAALEEIWGKWRTVLFSGKAWYLAQSKKIILFQF